MCNVPFFSIIIPAYQVEDYILECLNSLLEQKKDIFEVVIVDDGSTDNTGKLCDEYCEKYDDFSVYHTKNQGVSAARNVAIHKATGKYLIFLDSDDKVSSGSLGRLKAFIEEKNAPDVIVTRRSTILPDTLLEKECDYFFQEEKLSTMSSVEIYEFLDKLQDFWFGVWAFCVKREYIVERQLYFHEGIQHEDEEWIPKMFFNTENREYCNCAVYCNRIARPDSITSQLNIKKLFDRLQVVDLLQSYFTDDKFSHDIVQCIRRRCQKLVFGVLVDSCKYHKKEEYSQLKSLLKKKLYYLGESVHKPHKIAYLSFRIIGMTFTSYLLNRIKDKYNI